MQPTAIKLRLGLCLHSSLPAARTLSSTVILLWGSMPTGGDREMLLSPPGLQAPLGPWETSSSGLTEWSFSFFTLTDQTPMGTQAAQSDITGGHCRGQPEVPSHDAQCTPAPDLWPLNFPSGFKRATVGVTTVFFLSGTGRQKPKESLLNPAEPAEDGLMHCSMPFTNHAPPLLVRSIRYTPLHCRSLQDFQQ